MKNTGLRASVVVAQGLSSCSFQAPERRLNSCGPGAQLFHGRWLWEDCTLPLESNPSSPQLEKSPRSYEDPAQPKMDKIIMKDYLSFTQFSWLTCLAQFSRSVVSNSATPWTAACQASLPITNSQSPPKPMFIESVIPSIHLILCRPLLLLSSNFPSIRSF